MSNQPWTRQRIGDDLEPMLWFGRFTLYREMGTERSLLGAVNKANKRKKKQSFIPGSWSEASKKWNWKSRAESWDLAEIERLRIESEADRRQWTAARFTDANKLRDRANELLALPVIRETVQADGKTYIIEPLSSKQLRDAAAVLKLADELARITTRETLPKTETDITSGGEKIAIQKVAGFDDV